MTQTTVSPARRAETAAQLRRGRILRTVRSILRHLLLALLAAIWLVPILWLLVTSFSTDRGINVRQFFPASYTLRNYVNILFHPDSVAQFPRWFTNTLVVACFNCVISTCFVLMVAYALSCCRFKGRKLIQNLSVSVNLFPGVLAMIAVYFVLKYLNLTNSYAGLIMVYAGSSGLGYLICKGFFDTIPISLREVAPLISLDDKDEAAKRFDNFVYGLLLCELEGLPGLTRAQRQLKNTAALLEQKATIPQVQAKLPLIREVQTDEFLTSHDLLRFEEMRQELRELVKFLVDGLEGQKPIYTALADPVLEQTEGKALDSGYDFGEYRERVNRYIMEHRNDTLAIHKLTQNIPLSQGDYIELEHIFTSELGSKEDYAREFKDTPFGLLVRKVAKLDHEAAMQAFSKFINDESLNAKQIAFVQKVIHYIEQNGYVESKAVLMKPPFDQPILFTRLFDGKMGGELMETIDAVRENAVHVTA